ncbi:MAG: hypothetical protein JRN53_06520 [Nitrososphaerota archaeon]|nr:hypothetical protein [Nitrososphaerota archaeon]
MAAEELDLLSKKILMLIGNNKVLISKIEYSGLAARQTIHSRIEGLIKEDYIKEQRGSGFPPSRQLTLTDKGLRYLTLTEAQEGVSLVEQIKNETSKTELSPTQRERISSIINTTINIHQTAYLVMAIPGIGNSIKIKFVLLFNAAKNLLDYLQLEFEAMNDLEHHRVSSMIEADVFIQKQGLNGDVTFSDKPIKQSLKMTVDRLLKEYRDYMGEDIEKLDQILKDYPDKVKLIKTYAELMSQALDSISRELDKEDQS